MTRESMIARILVLNPNIPDAGAFSNYLHKLDDDQLQERMLIHERDLDRVSIGYNKDRFAQMQIDLNHK